MEIPANKNIPLQEKPFSLWLAPMAGITDCAFRALCAEAGGIDGAFVPMIGAAAVMNAGSRRQSFRLIDWRRDERRNVQLFGSDFALMKDACLFLLDLGAESININMGCQMPKIIKSGSGSALLKDTDNAARLLEMCVKTAGDRADITVKLRLGWDCFNIVPLLKSLKDIGVSAAFVHGRLGTDGFSGNADMRALKCAADASSVPFYANGDINDPASAVSVYKRLGCRGVMIGRGAMGYPCIFSDAAELLRSGSESGMRCRRHDLSWALKHINYAEIYSSDTELASVRRLRRHLICYPKLRDRIVYAETFEALRQIVNDAAAEEN